MSRTRQELFNTAYLDIIKQGSPALAFDSDRPYCAYRGANGRACAIGQLLPDKLRLESLMAVMPTYPVVDGKTDEAKLLHEHLIPAGIVEEDFEFLHGLQMIHDQNAISHQGERRVHSDGEFLRGFRIDAARFANRWGLTVPDLPTTPEETVTK